MKPISLDTTRQRDLYERAAARMAQLLPGWSDEYPSDPAVTVLELTAYLSDIQNYALDQVREAHYRAYLKLLGGEPEPAAPARLLADPESRAGLYPGMRFYIDGVPFEVSDGWQSADNRVADAVLDLDGAALHIAFQKPLRAHVPVRLWLELAPEPGRTPPDGETPPPVSLLAQTPDREGRIAECLDGTCGLLRSGWLEVTPEADSDALRFQIVGEPEGAPELVAAVLEPVALEQRYTRSLYTDLRPPFPLPQGVARSYRLRLFLPEGEGWREEETLFYRDGHIHGWRGAAPPVIRVVALEPDFDHTYPLREIAMEEVELDEADILPQSLHLMVEEGGVWYDCPVREPEPDRTLPRGCRWDAAARRLRFGDGRDFRVPREGRFLIAGCARSLCAGGNGAGGALEQGGVRLCAIRPAGGGRDGETARDAFLRAAREQEQLLRAVTCQDHEQLARRTPGLALERVRALPNRFFGRPGAGVTVLAKPRSKQATPTLTDWQAHRLKCWLDRFRLVGVPVEVRGPRYCALEVRVSIDANGAPPHDRLRAEALRLTDGVSGPLDFGAEISYTALFSALGAVPGVRAVRSLELRTLSRGGSRTQDGGVRLAADTLPYLAQFHITEG